MRLENKNALGVPSCIAFEFEVDLDEYEDKKIVLVLGEEDEKANAEETSLILRNLEEALRELREVKEYWNGILKRIQVKTEDVEVDFMLNGWAMYETIVCRLFARSAYYQSGGALGFRDQLQDSLSLKYISEEMLKKQIIKHSMHQFEEGDVEHWWHDETKRGIRTKFSDDLLWLVYSVCEYIEFTGDFSLLDIEATYLVRNATWYK